MLDVAGRVALVDGCVGDLPTVGCAVDVVDVVLCRQLCGWRKARMDKTQCRDTCKYGMMQIAARSDTVGVCTCSCSVCLR